MVSLFTLYFYKGLLMNLLMLRETFFISGITNLNSFRDQVEAVNKKKTQSVAYFV